MIVVAIIGLLAAIAVPNFVKARTSSQRNTCMANLKQMDGIKASWALEQKKNNADTPTDADLIGPTLFMRSKPPCPGGGSYGWEPVDTKVTCSLGPAPDLHIY